MNNLSVVVGESNRGKCASGDYRNPHESIRQIGPQQGRNDDRNCNQQPTHRGCARFFLMGLRSFFANILADLELAQAIDNQRSDNQSCEQCSKAGKGSAKSQVTKDAERREVVEQLLVQQPIEQSASVLTSVIVSVHRTQWPGAISRLPTLVPASHHGRPSAEQGLRPRVPVPASHPPLPAWP